MNKQNPNSIGQIWAQWRTQRKSAQLARQRQQEWEAIRAAQGTTTGQHQPLHNSRYAPQGKLPPQAVTAPTPGPGLITGSGDRRLGLLLWPVAVAISFVLAVPVGSPLVSGRWAPLWVGLGLVLGAFSALGYRAAWRRESARWNRSTIGGLTLLVVVVASVLTGLATQRVYDGRAQLRGSYVDRSLGQLELAEQALSVLLDNQGLLNLPSEQALPLENIFAAAVEQDLYLSQLWNPATLGEASSSELLTVATLLNQAAGKQAEALGQRYNSLTNPEPNLVASAVATGQAAQQMLEIDVPQALDSFRRSIDRVAGGTS